MPSNNHGGDSKRMVHHDQYATYLDEKGDPTGDPSKINPTNRIFTKENQEAHYRDVVYYHQRKGGEWFHGRVSNAYRNNYDDIEWNKD
jgi:hypothetical protein